MNGKESEMQRLSDRQTIQKTQQLYDIQDCCKPSVNRN